MVYKVLSIFLFNMFRAPEELLLFQLLLLKALLTKRSEAKMDARTKKEIIISIALPVYMLYPVPKGLHLKVKSCYVKTFWLFQY